MKYLVVLFSTFIFCNATSAATPSQASIERLLTDTQADKILSSIQQQVNGMMQNTMQQALQGQAVSPEQQKILDDFRQKSIAAFSEQLDFDKLKSTYIQIYSESFSQAEVDQLIAFYESPTGKMFVAKMPLVMQKSMSLMQQKMGPLMQQIQQDAKEMKEQLDALKQNPPK
ncbi:MAG TPA: DUF2059 domain-containing protein [Burkholderiaceae bacterium]|jgi:hypothetical protein|nr:DUF2059 domain-containing protein [Burkholderiaceae bacterium]